MFTIIPKAVYNEAYRLLTEDASLDYIPIKQRAYAPRGENLMTPHMYPWVFIESGGISQVEVFRMNSQFEYNFTVAFVAMVFADEGRTDDMVFRDTTDSDANENKGVMDVIGDIADVIWEGKVTRFNVDGVIDYTISGVHTPSILAVQTHLMNPFVRGLQMDVAFQIQES